MGALITEKKKKSIVSLQGSAIVFGVTAIVLGVLLRRKYTQLGYVEPVISEMTDGYYGIMSGSLVSLLGIFGSAIINSRKVNAVVLYFFLLLACDGLCALDLLLVVPQVMVYGAFAWTYSDSPICKANTRYHQAVNDRIAELCHRWTVSAILLICITTAVSIASLLTLINTFKTGFALCEAESEPARGQERPIQLSPYSTQQQSVQPAQLGYVNSAQQQSVQPAQGYVNSTQQQSVQPAQGYVNSQFSGYQQGHQY